MLACGLHYFLPSFLGHCQLLDQRFNPQWHIQCSWELQCVLSIINTQGLRRGRPHRLWGKVPAVEAWRKGMVAMRRLSRFIIWPRVHRLNAELFHCYSTLQTRAVPCVEIFAKPPREIVPLLQKLVETRTKWARPRRLCKVNSGHGGLMLLSRLMAAVFAIQCSCVEKSSRSAKITPFFAHFEFFRNLQNSCEEILRKQMHKATAWTKVCFKYLPNYFKISAPMRRRMVRSRRTSRTHRFHMPLSDTCMVIFGFDRTVLVSAVLLAPAVVPPALPRVRLWQLRCAFIFHSRRAQALAHCSPSRKEAASLPVLVTWATSAWVCRYLEAEADSWL